MFGLISTGFLHQLRYDMYYCIYSLYYLIYQYKYLNLYQYKHKVMYL